MNEIILVSHGFQINYERGFTNGLAKCCDAVTLISSDRTDHQGLLPNVKSVNLRGSQSESRTKWQKIVNMLYYHIRLMFYVVTSKHCSVHVIGLIEPVILCGLLEGVIFRLFAKQYILTVHNLMPHDRHSAYQKFINQLAYRIATRLVVHTEKMKQDLIKSYDIAANKIVVMEHGIEPLSESDRSSVLPEPKEKPQILFFGRVVPYKGLDLLLEALKPMAGKFSLLIAGSSVSQELTLQIRDQISQHPARNDIVWRNEYISEESVGEIFIESDLLVLPYRHIDQSGVLFQALRYGLPMLASDVGAFPAYINSTCGKICQPNDIASLTAELMDMLSGLEMYSRVDIRNESLKYEWPTIINSTILKLY